MLLEIFIKSFKKIVSSLFGRLLMIKSKSNFYTHFVFRNIKLLLSGRLKYDSKTLKINQPIFLIGPGTFLLGRNCTFGYKLGGFHYKGSIEIQSRYNNASIEIGDNVATNNNVFICAANCIEIGDNTLIGQNVTITDFEAHGIHPNERRRVGEIGKVIIGRNVWLGSNVTILKNSSIGDNTIVASGAVVSGVFPSNVIIGGVPAKIIKAIT